MQSRIAVFHQSHLGNHDKEVEVRQLMHRMLSILLSTVVLIGINIQTVFAVLPVQYDVLIRDGRVLDGTGNPWFRADIGVVGDRIVAMGRLSPATAVRIVDADGRTVTPGFIDIHSHADGPGYGARVFDRTIHADGGRRI